GSPHTLQTTDLAIQSVAPDWRFQFLSIITDPTIAYILLLIGIYGLFFEFANPGFVLPGIAGTISVLLALYAFQLLPINYAGFALLLLGIAFMIAEAFVASFGALGIGGIIAFAVGSVLLLDTNVPGFGIAWQVILLMSLFSAGFFLVLMNLAIRSLRKKIVTGREALIGAEGKVIEISADRLVVRIQGEIWKAQSEKPLAFGQKIRVVKVSGLLLTVEPRSESKL
ncbi:MAG TPA: NfeD family protein, partial [Gammaproteobacteria bacterium]|nr:NfeD family protein [Gammaproteobacteria bacterium]